MGGHYSVAKSDVQPAGLMALIIWPVGRWPEMIDAQKKRKWHCWNGRQQADSNLPVRIALAGRAPFLFLCSCCCSLSAVGIIDSFIEQQTTLLLFRLVIRLSMSFSIGRSWIGNESKIIQVESSRPLAPHIEIAIGRFSTKTLSCRDRSTVIDVTCYLWGSRYIPAW